VKTIAATLVTALVVSGQAYAQSNVNKSSDKNDKKQNKTRALRDNQMDNVTAAGEENSALAANNSRVTVYNSGSVDLSGAALSGASGVNIVSSSDALVGNGVNVYSGTISAPYANSGADVNQSNDITQDTAQKAKIDGYYRGANSQLSVYASSDVNKSASSNSTFESSLEKNKTHDQTLDLSHTKTSSLSKEYSNTHDQSLDASLSKSASLSTEYSSSKSADASLSTNHMSSKDASASLSTDHSSMKDASKSLAANASLSATSSSLDADAALEAQASKSSSKNSSLDAMASKSSDKSSSLDAMASKSSDKSASLDAEKSFDASLNTSKSSSKTSSLDAYHSTEDTLSATDSKSSSLAASVSKAKSNEYSNHTVESLDLTYDKQGAVAFDSASGKYVAVDGSTVTASNIYTVALTDNALQNAQALNIVNAAGGMVANGVNIARTSNMNSAPTIYQTNSIYQVR